MLDGDTRKVSLGRESPGLSFLTPNYYNELCPTKQVLPRGTVPWDQALNFFYMRWGEGDYEECPKRGPTYIAL